ncbi:MAG: CPBP family intramembrane metalloprotease [Candidatus Sericytochromatia bacterium]|nr:CPBP family intramembrane metalloprotease [Candidatus Sericytochromatia bacterium]
MLLLVYLFRKSSRPHWPAWLAQALIGYALGAAVVLAFWLIFAAGGGLQLHAPRLSSLQMLHAVLLGWLVASTEETVFRGMTLELLGQRFGLLTALSGQALLYAGLHLLRPQALSLSGMIMLCGLFSVGCFLGLLRLHTGQLACSTGLHAGWISFSMIGAWSQALSWSPECILWSGNGNPAQGLSGMICFALLSAGLWHLLPAHRQLWHNEAKRQ